MLLVTDKGHYFTVVEDFDDPTVLWARSQDKPSIKHASETLAELNGREYPITDEPSWDYRFRIRVSRDEWVDYLEDVTHETHAHKLKPAIGQARGKHHPISKMVEEVFYYMSYNRPDRSKPGWLAGKPKAKASRTW